jgi:hypothetical protein
MAKKAKAKETNTKRWLWGLSFAYLLGYLYFASQTKTCTLSSATLLDQYWFSRLIGLYLACKEINELGDALAGAFAPVAFIWLAGAVFIQSQELSETRDVMSQQVAATLAQVVEMEASTTLLKAQTAILELQYQHRLADDEFDRLLQSLRRKIQDERFLWIESDGKSSNLDDIIDVQGSDVDFFNSVKDCMETIPDRIDTGCEPATVNVYAPIWSEVHALVSRLVAISERCSPAYRKLFDDYHIETLEEYVPWVINIVEKSRNYRDRRS